ISVNERKHDSASAKKNQIIATVLRSPSCATAEYIIREIDSSIQVKDSILTEMKQTSSTCLNKIAFGSGIDQGKVSALISNFKKNGFNLEINSYPPFPLNSNEILFYNADNPKAGKPIVYIQYSLFNTGRTVRNLQACLNQTVFSVPGIQLTGLSRGFRRNEIRYYNSTFADSIKILQNCLRTIYPDRIFYPVKISNTDKPAVAEIWIYDTVAKSKPYDVDQTLTNNINNQAVYPVKGGPGYTFRSLKEALSVNPDSVYILDLSNQNLTSIPDEVYKFKNLKEINIVGNNIVSGLDKLNSFMADRRGVVKSDIPQTLNYGDEISIGGAGVRLGPIVRNNQGEIFAIYSVPTNGLRDNDVYLSINRTPRFKIGTIEQQSKQLPLVGLIRLNEFGKSILNTSHNPRGVRNVEQGMEVFISEPGAKGSTEFKGVITNPNFKGSVYIDKGQNITINGFASDIKPSAGGSGLLLVDKDNYALGVLVAGDGKQSFFIPMQRILDDLYVTLYSRSSSKK
ncbi:MAG: leucine-rich repeat domain-containing protein, partial [Flavisolibacter sp.]